MALIIFRREIKLGGKMKKILFLSIILLLLSSCTNVDERGFYTDGENIRKHKITGTYYDPNGYDIDNHDMDGYNPEGYDYDGYTREEYKKILKYKEK